MDDSYQHRSFVVGIFNAGNNENTIMLIHQKMLGMSETDLSKVYFQYMAQYKIFIFIFNLVPYLALRVVG